MAVTATAMRARGVSSAGSILIITLWLVTILSMLAIAVARYLSLEVRLTRYRAAREQAMVRARAGVDLVIRRLALDAQAPEASGKTYDWAGDEWAEDPGVGSDTTVSVEDEASRLSLNGLTTEQLTEITGSTALAEAITDACDREDPTEDHVERDPPYMAKNASFTAPEELGELPGMTVEAYNTLRAVVTPYLASEEPQNINTVSAEVLRVLGLSDRAVTLVTRFRDGADGPDAHAQDGVFEEAGLAITETLKNAEGVDLDGTPDGALLTSNRFAVTSNVFTITAESRTGRPAVRVRIQAVVRRAGCPETTGPCILAWRE